VLENGEHVVPAEGLLAVEVGEGDDGQGQGHEQALTSGQWLHVAAAFEHLVDDLNRAACTREVLVS